MAHFAGNVHVRQEVHFDLQSAVALAGFTASALHIEGETARTVASYLRFLCFREQLTNRIPHARIRRRVRTWRTTDRRLINVDNLIEMLEATH